MVDKTLVSADSLSKIRELLQAVSNEKGGIHLALLAQSPDLLDRWSFVISAPWIEAEGPRASVAYLSSKLRHYLNKAALSAIDRISALRSDHRLVTTILHFLGLEVSLENDAHPIRDFVVEDVRFPMAFIFIADPQPGWRKAAGHASSNRRAVVRQ